MFNIDKNGIIYVNRGDSFELPLFINKGTDLVPLRWDIKNTGAEVFFALTEPNQMFEDALVRKKYTQDDINELGDVVIKMTHDDTKCLCPGKYYYQIKLKFPPDEDDTYQVNTIVPKTQFFIEE